MRRTRDEWKRIVGNFRNSGLTIRKFSRAEHIVEQSLRNWIKRLKKEDATTPEKAYGFVEVQTADAAWRLDTADVFLDKVGTQHSLTIRFRDDIAIDVHPDTNMDTLALVLALMVNLR